MKLKRILATVLALAMVLSTMGTVAFANNTIVANVNGVGYASLAEALNAAGKVNGEVTIELTADVEWETGGGHGSTPFVLEDSKAVVTINGGDYTITATGAGVGPIRAANDTLLTFNNVNFVDKSVSYDESAWEFTYLEFAGKLKFVDCDFEDEIQLDSESAEFENCTFESNEESVYAVWVSNGSVSFTENCYFTGYRGLKMHEKYGSDITSATIVNCKFESITKKPGIAIGDLNDTTTVKIADCKFINVQAGEQGNYIYETDTSVEIFDFKSSGNTVISGNLGFPYVGISGQAGTEDYRERVWMELTNVNASGSLEVKLYNNGKLLSTTTKRNYPSNGTVTVNAVVAGKLSDSWDTVWHVIPNVVNIPDKAELWIDGKLVDTKENIDTDSFKAEYKALTGVASGSFNSGIHNPKISGADDPAKYRENFIVEFNTIKAQKSVEVKIYTANGLLATSSLRESDRDDKNIKLIPVNGGLTANVVVNGRLAGSWDTVWEKTPNVADLPTTLELWVDGILMDTKDAFGSEDNKAKYIALPSVEAAAKIGNIKYATLQEALVAAESYEVIEVSAGIHKLTTISNKAVTIKGNKDAIIDCTTSTTMSGVDITFEGVTIKGANKNYTGLHHVNTQTYKDCNIDGEIWTYGVALFENCVFDQESADKYNIWTYGAKTATFKDCKFYSAGKSVLVYKENGSVVYNASFENCEFYASKAAEGKAAIEIDSSLNPYAVTIDSCSAVGFDAGSVSGDVLWNLKRGGSDNCSVTIDGVAVNLDVKPAEPIKVEFKPVKQKDAEDEISDLYNINLTCKSDINRLNSADLTFDFNAIVDAGAMDYEIIPVKDITVTMSDDADRYMFNYNGKDGVFDTAQSLTIAQVKITGYGKYTFAVKAAKTNAVHATTIANNLVDTYVSDDAAANEGRLDIDTKLEGFEITIPTRELTIKVTFPNVVEDNAADYQDMSVTIVGGTVNKTIDLGGDTDVIADYTVVENLPYNTAYTVTVSGAGYRTARYTINLTENKTLNFWNNVMDNTLEVEVGKASSATTTTFLAGDIVKDNKINIYDLSAVVSYFGTENLVAEHPEYAKYDLNRDGVIDSKDVAYVLVSWGE